MNKDSTTYNLTMGTMPTTSLEYHNQQAEHYDDAYQSRYWQIYNQVTWNYIQQVLPHDKNGTLILDAGGGTGDWSIQIAKLGYQVVLLDESEPMLAQARAKINQLGLNSHIHIQKGDITHLADFSNDYFDLVLAEGDPVSYCRHPERAIAELARVVKPGGHVTASVDNKLLWMDRQLRAGEWEKAQHIWQQGIAYMGGGTPETGFPAFVFTIEELIALFKDNGLTPVQTVGKHVYISSEYDLSDDRIYQQVLSFELFCSTLPSVAGHGRHIAIVGKK